METRKKILVSAIIVLLVLSSTLILVNGNEMTGQSILDLFKYFGFGDGDADMLEAMDEGEASNTFTFRGKERTQQGLAVYEDGKQLPFWVWHESNSISSMGESYEKRIGGSNIRETMKYWKAAGATGFIISTTEVHVSTRNPRPTIIFNGTEQTLIDIYKSEADKLGLDIVFGVKLSRYVNYYDAETDRNYDIGDIIYLIDKEEPTNHEKEIIQNALESALTPETFQKLRNDIDDVLLSTGNDKFIIEGEGLHNSFYNSIVRGLYNWTSRKDLVLANISESYGLLEESPYLSKLYSWHPYYSRSIYNSPEYIDAYDYRTSTLLVAANAMGDKYVMDDGRVYYYSKYVGASQVSVRDIGPGWVKIFDPENGTNNETVGDFNSIHDLGVNDIVMSSLLSSYFELAYNSMSSRGPAELFEDLPYFYGKGLDEKLDPDTDYNFSEFILYPGGSNSEIEARGMVDYLKKINRFYGEEIVDDEFFFDTDGDGILNIDDLDDDNDSYSDLQEIKGLSNYLGASNIPITYSLNIDSDNGIIIKNPNRTAYLPNEIINVTVIPNTGYNFTNWTGDYTGTNESFVIKMGSSTQRAIDSSVDIATSFECILDEESCDSLESDLSDKMIIWHHRSSSDLVSLQNVLDSGLINKVIIYYMHRTHADWETDEDILQAIEMVKNDSDVDLIWCRNLWSYEYTDVMEFQDFFNPDYYANEIHIMNQEAQEIGADYTCFDAEPYANSIIKPYLKGELILLTPQQEQNLSDAVRTATSKQGKVDFILPGGAFDMINPLNILSDLGEIKIAESTYYNRESKINVIPFEYDIFGAFVNNETDNPDIPGYPYFLISEILGSYSYYWEDLMGLFIYTMNSNVLELSEELRALGCTVEICDGLDNDCDGLIDEGGVCPSVPSPNPGSSRGPSGPGPTFNDPWIDGDGSTDADVSDDDSDYGFTDDPSSYPELISQEEFPSPSFSLERLAKDYWGYGLVLFMIGAVVLVVGINNDLKKKKIRKRNRKRMDDARNFVYRLRYDGHSDKYIEHLFIEKGWKEETVERLMKNEGKI